MRAALSLPFLAWRLQIFTFTFSFAHKSTPRSFFTRPFENSWNSTFLQNNFLAFSIFSNFVIFLAEVFWANACVLCNSKIISLVAANFTHWSFSSLFLGKRWNRRFLFFFDVALQNGTHFTQYTVMWHFNIDKKWQKWIPANRHVNKLYPQFPVLPRSPPFWRRVYYCRWQVTIYTLRFSVFTSVQLKFPLFFFGCFYFRKHKSADM